MKLKYESKDAIPEDSIDDFVEFKEGDAIVYLHADLAEERKARYRSQGDNTEMSKKLEDQAKTIQRLIDAEEARKAEKEQEEFDSKSKNGQHQEIIDDLKNKIELTNSEWESKYNELVSKTLEEKKQSIVQGLSSLAVQGAEKQLSRLISLDFSFNENGDIIVLDESGKATSGTLEDYKRTLGERYPHLVAEVQPNGGMGKGSTGGTGGNKKPEDYTESERVQLFKQNPEQFRQIFNVQQRLLSWH